MFALSQTRISSLRRGLGFIPLSQIFILLPALKIPTCSLSTSLLLPLFPAHPKILGKRGFKSRWSPGAFVEQGFKAGVQHISPAHGSALVPESQQFSILNPLGKHGKGGRKGKKGTKPSSKRQPHPEEIPCGICCQSKGLGAFGDQPGAPLSSRTPEIPLFPSGSF